MLRSEIKSKPTEDISILIQPDNYSYNFICECGDASELTVKECQNTEAIFISHTHIDHFINFDFILRHQIGIQRRVIICGPAGITEQVQSKIRAYQWNLIESNAIEYEVREIKTDGTILRSLLKPSKWDAIPILQEEDLAFIYSNDKFTVAFTILDHNTPSIAYLFKERDTLKINMAESGFKGGSWVRHLKQAFENKEDATLIEIGEQRYEAKALYHLLEIKTGDTLGVIMDHAASPANHEKIESLFQACHQVYIESFYHARDKELAEANAHSYSDASASIMKRCQVGKAIPVHFSRKYKEDEIEVLLQEFHDAMQ